MPPAARSDRQWSISERLHQLEIQDVPVSIKERLKFVRKLRSDIIEEAENEYKDGQYMNSYTLFSQALDLSRLLLNLGDELVFKDDKPLLFQRIQILLQMGCYFDVLDECEEVLFHEPTYNHVRVDKAVALYATYQYQECLKTLSYFKPQQRENNPRIADLVEKLKEHGFMFTADLPGTLDHQGAKPKYNKNAQQRTVHADAPFLKKTKKQKMFTNLDKTKSSSTNDIHNMMAKRESESDSDTSVASGMSDSELAQSLNKQPDQPVDGGLPIPSSVSYGRRIGKEEDDLDDDNNAGEWVTKTRRRRNTISHAGPRHSPIGSPNNQQSRANKQNVSGSSKKSKKRRHKSGNAVLRSHVSTPQNHATPQNGGSKNESNKIVTGHATEWIEALTLRLACRNCFTRTAYYGRSGYYYHGNLRNHSCFKDILICPDTKATKAFKRSVWCQIRERVHKDFKGEHKLCYCYQADKPCKVPDCQFPHTDEEKQVWNAERKGNFNRKDVMLHLKSNTHRLKTSFQGSNVHRNVKKTPQRGVVMIQQQSLPAVPQPLQPPPTFINPQHQTHFGMQPQPTTILAPVPAPLQQSPRPVAMQPQPTTLSAPVPRPLQQPPRPVAMQPQPTRISAPVPRPLQQSPRPVAMQPQPIKMSAPVPGPLQPVSMPLINLENLLSKSNLPALINQQPVAVPASWQQHQRPVGMSFGNFSNVIKSNQNQWPNTEPVSPLSSLPMDRPPFPVQHKFHQSENQQLKAAKQQSALFSSLLEKVKGRFTYICQQCCYLKPPCITFQNRSDSRFCGHPWRQHPWSTCKILAHEIHENGKIIRSIIRPKLPNNIADNCRYYVRSYCKRGDSCNFAHDSIELEIWKLEQRYAIDRDSLVEFCGSMAAPTRFDKPVSSAFPDTLAAKEQAKCPFHLKFVCGTCWSRGGQQRRQHCKDTTKCEAGHSWKEKICLVFSGQQKWIKVNGRHPNLRPNTKPVMCKNKSKCDYADRHGQQCMHCHSEEEKQIWIFMAKHKLKSLDEIVESQNLSANNEKQKEVQKSIPQRVNYHCTYCKMDFNSTPTLEFHISTLKHKRCVNSDTERSWKHRSPPLGVVNGQYVICNRHKENSCPYSNVDPANNHCTLAHTQEELEEWKERHEYRMMKRRKANESKLFSFMDQLLIEYNSSTSEVKLITEKEPPEIQISCEKKLNCFIDAIDRERDKVFKDCWTFQVECIDGVERLKRVGLLYDEHRLHFFLSHPKEENKPQVCPGNLIMDGYTYTVDVHFTSNMLGSFHQWVVFDFGKKPVMVRKLNVHVGAKEDRPKYMKQLSERQSTIIWDTSNTEIIRPPEPSPIEEDLIRKYKPPSANLNIDDLNVGELTQENYKHRMHKMVHLEERDRMKKINRFNTMTEIEIESTITVESYAGTEMFIAQNGELFGKIELTETLNCDTESSQIIMESVQSVLCKFDSESNKAYELKIVSNESINGRTKDYIYVTLNAKFVEKLKLKAKTKISIEVQFQVERLFFCEMHYAIDSLENMDFVFPIAGEKLAIPAGLATDVLNEKQEQAVEYMRMAGNMTVCGPPLVIYGPFGTGKTRTMAESVKKILLRHGTKVLICTMSNSGADLYITEHLDEYLTTYPKCTGLKPTLLRVYQSERRIGTIPSVVRKYCLIDKTTNTINLPTRDDVKRSRVVICTLNMALRLVSLNLKGHFTHILIDEAGQALETQAIMPLAMAEWNSCVAIAGDHIQMSPKVYSEEARIGGFDRSILKRLHDHYEKTGDQNTIFLHHNYRTCKEILTFVSDIFYKTKLSSKKLHPPHPTLYPLSFYAVRGQDHLVGTSYCNRDEVVELGFRVEGLYRNWPTEWGEKKSIGVVTPYNSQVREIRKELRRRKLNDVTVESVRNVQGKEFRALFISVVRTRATLVKTHVAAKYNSPDESAEFYYGFLSDEKLLNTAFTRAKSLLMVVGDPIAMCSIGLCSKVWEKFLQKCENHGSLYPTNLTLQQIRGDIDATNIGLNPFAAPFKPSVIKEKSVDVPKRKKPAEDKITRQISEDFPRLSTISRDDSENFVSGDFSFFTEIPADFCESEQWQSEDEEEIDEKKINDSILKELRRQVNQEMKTDNVSAANENGSSSNLIESKRNEEPSIQKLDKGSNEDSIPVTKQRTNFQQKQELEQIAIKLFVPEKDHSNLQGSEFFEEYDPEDTDISSEELDQDKKYGPLLESEPEKYKKCKFHLDVRGKTYATTLEEDILMNISIISKHNRGRALNNDEVIIEVQENEEILEEVDIKALDNPENEEKSKKMYGKVVQVLKRASDPYLRKLVCMLDQHSNSLMVPVNKDFPKLCIQTKDKNKSPSEDVTVDIYTLSKQVNSDKPFYSERKVVVTNKDRLHKLFVVRYWKWHDKMTYPMGFVTEELPPATNKAEGIRILKLIHGVEDTWKKKVREELDKTFSENWKIPEDEMKKRTDLRNIETFTIDPKGCQDIDDALSIRKLSDSHYEVGVHIADVSYFVGNKTLLDEEAKKRATTYYPTLSAPINMLPSRLSTNFCSLIPGKDRLAMSVFMDIRNDGLHSNTKIVKSVIQSRQKFMYKEVEDIIHNGNNDVKPSIVTAIHVLNELAQKTRAARLKEGRFSYNEDENEEEASCPLAHSLIEEFMILANKAVAEYLMEIFPQCVPLRRQLSPDPDTLQEFQVKHLPHIRNSKEMLGKFKEYVDSSQCNCDDVCKCGEQSNTITMQTREWNQLVEIVNNIKQGSDASLAEMMKIIQIVCTDNKHPKLSVMMAHYYMIQEKSDYKCSGQSLSDGRDLAHHSLEVDFYTHFTSPIRRYIDIVVHRLIDAAINQQDKPYTEEEISSICYNSTIKSSNAKAFEKRTKLFTMALQLKEVSISCLSTVEQASDKNISFVFPRFMQITGRAVGLNKLKPSKIPGVDNDIINVSWKQRIYDAKAKPTEVLPKMDSSAGELDANRFVVTFNSTHWQEILSGIEDDDIHQIRAAMHYAAQEIETTEKEKNQRTVVKSENGKQLKKEVTSEILDRHGNRYHFVEFEREYTLGHMVEVKLMAGLERGIPEPKIQLFNLTPELDICLEHRSDPVTCFSQLANKKPRGANDIPTYQKRWLAVLSMESASNAVSEDDSLIIRNVSINWTFDSDKQSYNGVFQLPTNFCVDRSIRFYHSDYLCVRYSGLDVPHKKLSQNRSEVKSTWVGHCYTTEVNLDKMQKKICIRLNQSVSSLPQSVLYPKPKKKHLCIIELIPRGKSDRRLERAVNGLSGNKLNQDIVLLKKHKMGGKEDSSTANILAGIAKTIKVGKIKGVGLPPPNNVQKQAIEAALEKPFTVIQGPPGTGKTVTGAQLAYYFSEMNTKIPPTGKGRPQVLYCGPSNKSVDVVAGYLKRFPGLPIVRVYSETIEKKDFPLPWEKNVGKKADIQSSTDPDHVNVALHHLIRTGDNSKSAEICKLDREFRRLRPETVVTEETRSRYLKLIDSAKEEELKKYKIILATCNSAGSNCVKEYCSIIQCIIDEAGMCSEPESLIPLVMCSPYQVVLIGDHKQLRPIIKEKHAEDLGLGISLLERYEARTMMLTIQYRMHQKICEFPSSAFYDKKLVTDDSVKNRKIKNWQRKFWPAGSICPTVFCHVYGKEETLTVNSSEGSEQSKSNPQEVYHVVRIACKLLDKGVQPKDILILSQYRLQCQRIRDDLKVRGIEEVQVSTVVLSQGSECDYVIMSTVRSLPRVEIEKRPSIRWMKMNLGFIADENQMNVALTRAKKGLILIGNQYLLETHSKWKELLQMYRQNKCLVDHASDFKP
ncbi:3'-5' exoribonuclease HELZ2-like [Antedon mediterranea]|uniref:3'-5' exoribonuclease HELZ2-like n=1 Tax=Antedon mediterranea TaxID=105859 RepID=UPI003AF69F52